MSWKNVTCSKGGGAGGDGGGGGGWGWIPLGGSRDQVDKIIDQLHLLKCIPNVSF